MEEALPYTDTLAIYLALAAVVMPFIGFAINFFLPAKVKAAGWVATLTIFVSLIFSISVFTKVWNNHQIHAQQLWFTIGATKVYAGVLLNNLSVLMLLLVSAIALPVHIYSMAYMGHDEGFNRYFTYLGFFCFSMLALVVVDSLVTFYAFWELVGFSSYLLIGFWYTRDSATQANKKAFIMNRIGDIGLLTAILILFAQYHTFDLVQLFGDKGLVMQSGIQHGIWISPTGSLPVIWQYVACIGLFMAVAAKSAQFPLHTWLPDAMEGPTSVSSLIHAATMVAAGVFLLARVYPVFNVHELDALAIIGCFTAFMAATIALTQSDLKRILAYSTISQLGYMVMAMGIGAYASSLFHLVTHAFFKCLLFLCAGVVIHEMSHLKEENNVDFDAQDIGNMGGLRKKLPFTFGAFVIGGLALVGIPLTSGYLSKDGILIQGFEWAEGKEHIFKLIPIFALLTSWLTAFYVARLIFKVFYGEFRLEQQYPSLKTHFSDGGWQYRVPLLLLSLCCLFPLFSLHPFLYEHAWVFNGLAPSEGLARENVYHTIVPAGVTIMIFFIIYWAYSIYVQQKRKLVSPDSAIYQFSYNQWYIDRFYLKRLIPAVMQLSALLYWIDRTVIDGLIHSLQRVGVVIARLTAWSDKYIVDGLLHLLAAIVQSIGNFARSFQSGKVQYYLLSMLVVILAIFILKILI